MIAVPDESIGQAMASLVRLYAAKAQAGHLPPVFGRNSALAVTDAAIACTAMMEAADISLFQVSAREWMPAQAFAGQGSDHLAQARDLTEIADEDNPVPAEVAAEDEADVLPAEKVILALPSTLGIEECITLGLGAVAHTELELRRAQMDDTLVVSFVGNTRVFSFSADGEVEEVESFRGFELGESTLYADSLPDDRAVQVTSNAVLVSDAEGGMVTDSWRPPAGTSITAVSGNKMTILVSLAGAALVVLDVSSPTIKVQAQRSFDSAEEVSPLMSPMSLTVTRQFRKPGGFGC